MKPKLLYYRTAFIELTDSRPYTQSGSPLPIPISEIRAYCEFFGIETLREKERLFRLVRAQDRAYIEYRHEQASKEGKKVKKSKRAVAER